MEARLSIAPWDVAPNANNEALARGAREARHRGADDPPQRQGLLEPRLLRHGLPDQRQAVDAGHDDPAALDRGATLVTRVRADRLVTASGDAW